MKVIIQFSYRRNTLPDLPTLDCRVIPNPHAAAPTSEGRRALVRAHPKFEMLVQEGITLLEQHPTIAVGCAYGRDRSGAVAAELAARTGALIDKISPA